MIENLLNNLVHNSVTIPFLFWLLMVILAYPLLSLFVCFVGGCISRGGLYSRSVKERVRSAWLCWWHLLLPSLVGDAIVSMKSEQPARFIFKDNVLKGCTGIHWN